MKKFIILLILAFTMTGCAATANINIDKNEITEEYIIKGNKSDYSNIKENATFPVPLYYDADLSNPYSNSGEKESGVDYYDVVADDTNRKITINGKFSLDNHIRSSAVRNCFRYYNIVNTEITDEKEFSTSNGLTCAFSNFTVNIKTPYKVTSNNADKVDKKNNIYTWKFTDKNSTEKGIDITINFSKKYNQVSKPNQSSNNGKETEKKEENTSKTIWPIVIVPLSILIVVAGIVLKKKKDKASSL